MNTIFRRYLFLTLGLMILAIPALSQTTRENGIDLYRASQYDDAIKVLKSVTDLDSNDRLAWLYLGAALSKSGKRKDAVNAFKKGQTRSGDFLVPGDDLPVTKLSKPRPSYTDLARRNNTTGTVRLAVELRADGNIGFIIPVEALSDGLTETSIAAARSITFAPAVKGGKPVTTIAIFEYTFSIY